MAPSGPRRRARRNGSAIAGLVLSLVLLAILWISLAAPFRDHGDPQTHAGRSATGLRAEATRRDDRARLTITGRVPAGTDGAVVRILGRADVAAPCPTPEVLATGALVLPAGSSRVGWSPIAGRAPGRVLRSGRAFTTTGTVALRDASAMRLCVYLARSGSRPGVLRSVRTIVPSSVGLTPLSVVARPLIDTVVLPALRLLALLLVAAAGLWAATKARRRIRLVRTTTETSPLAGWTAAAWDLPPLPADVHVPDTLPWPTGDDDLAPRPSDQRGGDASDPRGGDNADHPAPDAGHGPATVVDYDLATTRAIAATPVPTRPRRSTGVAGASALLTGARREARWRARRRREVEAEGGVFDPQEQAPFHVRAWAVGAEGEQLAAERFATLAGGFPGVHVLHDRREPFRAHANIDHVLVGPAGVTVVDTKHWAGAVKIAEDRLLVRGIDRTKAIDGVCGQVSAIRSLLAAAGLGAVPVTGVLHWTREEGATLDGSLELRGVPLLDASGTMLRAVDGGVLGLAGVRQVFDVLERGLPPAG